MALKLMAGKNLDTTIDEFRALYGLTFSRSGYDPAGNPFPRKSGWFWVPGNQPFATGSGMQVTVPPYAGVIQSGLSPTNGVYVVADDQPTTMTAPDTVDSASFKVGISVVDGEASWQILGPEDPVPETWLQRVTLNMPAGASAGNPPNWNNVIVANETYTGVGNYFKARSPSMVPDAEPGDMIYSGSGDYAMIRKSNGSWKRILEENTASDALPGVMVRKTSSLGSTLTKGGSSGTSLTFNVASPSDPSMWSSTGNTDRFVAPRTGWYSADFTGLLLRSVSTASDNAYVETYFQHSASSTRFGHHMSYVAPHLYVNVESHAKIYMESGSYIRLMFWIRDTLVGNISWTAGTNSEPNMQFVFLHP